LTSPILTTPQINDSALNNQYIFASANLAANRTISLPLLTGNDTFVFQAFTQTLTNKTINTASNTLTIAASDITTGTLPVARGGTGAVNLTSGNVLLGAGTSAITFAKAAPSGAFTGTTDVQTLTNKTLTAPRINDTSANNVYIFGVNELAANRTITLPLLTDNDIFVFNDHTATLTNKTINTSSNTLTIAAGDITTGTLPVARGGTGAVNLTSGNVLLGAGTSAITFAKASPSGSFVGTTDSQILSNKTLTAPQINDTSANNVYIFGVNELAADRTVTLPLLAGNDIFVFEAFTQTLTNKTINTASNTLTIAAGDITSGTLVVARGGTGAVNLTSGNVLLGAGTSAITFAKTAPSGAFVGTTDSQILSNKTLTLPQINDTSSDHQYIFGVSELASDRTVTLPLLAGNDVFVFEAFSQTLTNKTIAAGSNTISGLTHGSEVDDPSSGVHGVSGSVVGTTDTQVLSNKTLTLPQINDSAADHQYIFSVANLAADRTVSLPLLTGNDVFVFAAFTQNLTNKTLDNTNSLTVLDTNFTLQDATTSRQAVFELSGITDSNTRIMTVPDSNTDILIADAGGSGTSIGATTQNDVADSFHHQGGSLLFATSTVGAQATSQRFWASGKTCYATQIIDLTIVGPTNYDIVVPSGCTFLPDEVRIIQTSTGSVDATIDFGDTGGAETYLSNILQGNDTAGDVAIFQGLLTANAPATNTLRTGVAGVGSAGACRIIWIGVLLENE